VKRPEGRAPAQNLGWEAKHVGCHYRRNAQRYSAAVVASPKMTVENAKPASEGRHDFDLLAWADDEVGASGPD